MSMRKMRRRLKVDTELATMVVLANLTAEERQELEGFIMLAECLKMGDRTMADQLALDDPEGAPWHDLAEVEAQIESFFTLAFSRQAGTPGIVT